MNSKMDARSAVSVAKKALSKLEAHVHKPEPEPEHFLDDQNGPCVAAEGQEEGQEEEIYNFDEDPELDPALALGAYTNPMIRFWARTHPKEP